MIRRFTIAAASLALIGCSNLPSLPGIGGGDTDPGSSGSPSASAPSADAIVPSGKANDASAKGGLLEAHNVVRARKGVPPLTWSADLAKYAKEWADHKASTTCRSGHRPFSGQYAQQHGENLFFASGIRSSSAPTRMRDVTATEVVEAWASEEQYYNYSANSCSGVCGHYTQVVWKATTEVGCARATCGDQAQFWVCNYSPAGNKASERPY